MHSGNCFSKKAKMRYLLKQYSMFPACLEQFFALRVCLWCMDTRVCNTANEFRLLNSNCVVREEGIDSESVFPVSVYLGCRWWETMKAIHMSHIENEWFLLFHAHFSGYTARDQMFYTPRNGLFLWLPLWKKNTL